MLSIIDSVKILSTLDCFSSISSVYTLKSNEQYSHLPLISPAARKHLNSLATWVCQSDLSICADIEAAAQAINRPYANLVGHSIRTAIIGVNIAKSLKLSKKEIELIALAGLLHDIGKIVIPDSILEKPDTLTDSEYKTIQAHSNNGYLILKDDPWLHPEVLEAILSHHERLDGSGYPNHLVGTEITFFTKIISVADAFDAMTSTRVYKASKPIQASLEELKNLNHLYDESIVVALDSCYCPLDVNIQPKRRITHALIYG